LKFLLFALLFVAVFSFFVMRLWNWLMPAVFGWHALTYWQALGLLVLSKILFGGFRGRPGPRFAGRRRMMERWARMTPQERERLRESMRKRCGAWPAPAGQPEANA